MSHCTAGQAQAAGRNLLHDVHALGAQTPMRNKPTRMRALPRPRTLSPGADRSGSRSIKGLKSQTGSCLHPAVSSLLWPLRFPSKEHSFAAGSGSPRRRCPVIHNVCLFQLQSFCCWLEQGQSPASWARFIERLQGAWAFAGEGALPAPPCSPLLLLPTTPSSAVHTAFLALCSQAHHSCPGLGGVGWVLSRPPRPGKPCSLCPPTWSTPGPL